MSPTPTDTPAPRIDRRRRAGLAALGGLTLGAAAGLAGGYALAGDTRPRLAITPSRRFAEKAVLVTGGTSGIGRAAVLAFAAEGAKVAFCGRRAALDDDLRRAVAGSDGRLLHVRADVRDPGEVAAFVEAAADQFGGLDIALNNAGITVEKPLHEMTLAEWTDVVDTNLRGVFLAMQAEIPHLLRRGGGVILVTASSVATYTAARRSVYTATKAGLIGLVRAAALDYGDQGIRINALLPGTTDTPFVRRVAGMENAPDEVWRLGAAQWGKANVRGLHRMATPEEIAAFALAMAAPELTYLTGAALSADGGSGTG